MGLVDFVKSAGRKVGMFGGRAATDAIAKATAVQAQAVAANDAAARVGLQAQATAADIHAAILSYVEIGNLNVTFDGTTAVVTGSAPTQADREKAVLVAGNTEGVACVDDRLTVVNPAPAATYHTVVAGDTLSKLAGRYYGAIRLFDGIFEANKPMLAHPDQIYPGQVLRIPPVQAPTHTVAAGETLGTIANHWYGDPKAFTKIAAANNIADANKISVGQALKIPLTSTVG